MSAIHHSEDPEPCERVPAGLRPLFVPVRPGPSGWAARFFRTPLGGRTAVGFTTRRGWPPPSAPDQAWIRLSEPALRALAAPLGITALTVDPQLSAPAAAARPTARPTLARWHRGTRPRARDRGRADRLARTRDRLRRPPP